MRHSHQYQCDEAESSQEQQGDQRDGADDQN
jgi:hypothetical protein